MYLSGGFKHRIYYLFLMVEVAKFNTVIFTFLAWSRALDPKIFANVIGPKIV